MELINAIEKRSSVRKFREEKVKFEVIEKIIETVRLSPSWKNNQEVRFTYVDDDNKLNLLRTNLCMQNFTYNVNTLVKCPQLIVVSVVKGLTGYEEDGTYTTSRKDGYEMFDAGIYSSNFTLVAKEYGIGTTIMGIFNDMEVSKVINLPQNEKVCCLIALGYPLIENEDNKPKSRLEVKDILRHN